VNRQNAMNRTGIAATAALLLLSVTACAGDLATAGEAERLGFSAARLQRITSWYQARVDAGELPGAVVAIARNGKLAYMQAAGFQDAARKIPMQHDAIFWIASMTKPVTSVAAMMLVDDGRLELDAPVAQYLPQLKDMQVGVEKTDAAGTKQIELEASKRPMTVRDLLRHTAGLVYPPQFNAFAVNQLYNRANFSRDGTLADFVASLAPLPLAHQPGEVWEYSWGVDVLARVVEVASGLRFDEFLQSRIFHPLRMVDTGFYVPQHKLARLVEAPEPRDPQFDVTRPRNLLSGGGGLVSTAPDYLRFCQMLLNGGELDGVRILKRETVAMMTTDALPPGIRFVHLIGPKQGTSWGLGFSIRTGAAASSIPGSVGSYSWSGLWGTYFWVDPALNMIVLQMIQLPANKVGPSFAALRNLSYGALRAGEESFQAPLSPVSMSAEALAGYAGRYYFGVSSSSRDRNGSGATSFAGIGLDVEMADGGAKVILVRDRWPAAEAGIRTGDVIAEADGAPLAGNKIDRVIGKLRGAAGSEIRLRILRADRDAPMEITLKRVPIYLAGVELEIRNEGGKLVATATGRWPVLDFEAGKPMPLVPASLDEFYADGGDHTRLAFTRDPQGKLSGAVLNPGPWQLGGLRIDR
jgi:CubicO group peptidase (beta-lactamase class C family)